MGKEAAPPHEFPKLRSMFEAKIIALSDVVLSIGKGNTLDSYIVNG